MINENRYSAIVIGATGAVGRELIDHLIKSDKWGCVIAPVRRKISRWENLQDLDNKLKIVEVESLDLILKSKEEIDKTLNLTNSINTSKTTVFCCLGSLTGKGKEEFYKVDYTYVEYSGLLCEKFNIPHFSLCSSVGANSKSCFYYIQVKGQAEDRLKQMQFEKIIQTLSIFQPGFILNRDNDKRFIETCCSCLPCLGKIPSSTLGLGMMNEAVRVHENVDFSSKIQVYSNSEIIQLSLN